MALEIERKFLVKDDRWREGADGVAFKQGYLQADPECAVRIRIAGPRAMLTIKGQPRGVTRLEFEYEIPLADAEAMLASLAQKPFIHKTRYTVPYGGNPWEVDVFEGENAGLVVAEIELPAPDAPFERPPWLGAEVTDDPRYLNANLIRAPYRTWSA